MPKRPNYTQKFRREWLQDPVLRDWLVEKKKSTGASVPQCRYCQCVLIPKLSDLKYHGKSKKHIKNAEAVSPARQPTLKCQSLTKSTQEHIAEGQIALFVAEHTSMATSDHLSELCKSCFPDSSVAARIQVRRSKCSGIIKNVLYPHFMSELRKGIGNNLYSLLLDESTDCSDRKFLGIAIIYNDEEKERIISSFLSLTELEESNAEGIVTALKKTLNDFGLDLKNLRGIGTDNASVMVGVNNGVYEKLKKDVPNLVLIRCVCHSL